MKKPVKTVTARKQRKAPQTEAPAPRGGWWARVCSAGPEGVVRALVLFFAATLPLYYDLAVPEVSGDIRWTATEFFAGLCAVILIAAALARGRGRLSLRWPVILWIALGLGLWAAVSLVDAINWTRGIILIKALYAQLTLVAVVYHVATPGFGRKLLWALVLPLFVTSLLGIWQFHGYNDVSFHAALNGSWLFFWLKPVVWVADAVCAQIADWVGWGERNLRMVGLATSYFMQSAVPGSTFANKNLAGSWTGMMLPVALYLLVTAKRWPGQALASVLLALGALFLVYSRARASWVALFAALMTLGLLVVVVPAWRQAVARHLDWKHLLWLLLPVLVVVRWGGDVSPVSGAYAVDRTPAQQVAALAGSSWNEIGGRLAYNLNSLAITKDYWFNGVGLGSFFSIYPAYYDAIVVTPTNSYNVMARPQRTHTDLMQSFDEMGVPGGFLYAGLFIAGIAMALRLAGNRAGALGGKVVMAGLGFAVLALALFLEQQGMLALPGPWNWVFYLGMAGLVLGLLAWAAHDAWRVQKERTAADDVQLMGLMAGMGLLTICINALMDFPMQLPTAPGAAALLLGLVTAVYIRYRPHAKAGPHITLNAGRVGPLVLLVIVLGAWGWAMYDGYYFRRGNIYLKAAMGRLFGGVTDDVTVALLESAYKEYPYDQRIIEHMGVAYSNYNGSQPMAIEDRIAKIEWVLKSDPWGPNHLINLSGQYLQLAELKQQQGDTETANVLLKRVEELYAKLQVVANFSHFTWGIGGLLKMLEGKNEESVSLFRRALAIQPNYPPAVYGIQTAMSRTTVKPLTVRDAITGRQ